MKKWLIWLIVVLVLIVVGIIIWLVTRGAGPGVPGAPKTIVPPALPD